MNFEKKVVLIGLGLYEQGSGISAAKFFIGPPLGPSLDHSVPGHPQTRRAGKCQELVITDLKSTAQLKKHLATINQLAKKSSTKITWHLGGHREEDFKTADLIFQNPSVPASSPYLKIAAKRNIPIVNDWSIFLSVHDPKIFIGVTGTRGKSTTTALIYEMMKKKYKKVILAGNIGLSPLNFIDSYKGEPIVAELSSWLLHHFPAVQKSPPIAVVTNLMKDHLDKYQSMKEYIADKENIFKFQKPGDVVILNWDNQYTRKMGNKIKNQIIRFSLKKHWPQWVLLNKIKLPGEHNLANALASAAAAESSGVSRQDILSVLKSFPGLPNRLELIRTIRGGTYYNDTTATTPDATIAALTTLGSAPVILRAKPEGSRTSKGRDSSPAAQNDIAKNIILIAGGADKKLEYRELAKYIKRYCKAVILLSGTATEKLELRIKNYELRIVKADSMNEAVKAAKAIARRGDIILLSPAAASFGLFKNEFDRGEEFERVVKKFIT